MKKFYLVLSAACLLLLGACGNSSASEESGTTVCKTDVDDLGEMTITIEGEDNKVKGLELAVSMSYADMGVTKEQADLSLDLIKSELAKGTPASVNIDVTAADKAFDIAFTLDVKNATAEDLDSFNLGSLSEDFESYSGFVKALESDGATCK